MRWNVARKEMAALLLLQTHYQDQEAHASIRPLLDDAIDETKKPVI